jgi:hypothetical protein
MLVVVEVFARLIGSMGEGVHFSCGYSAGQLDSGCGTQESVVGFLFRCQQVRDVLSPVLEELAKCEVQ